MIRESKKTTGFRVGRDIRNDIGQGYLTLKKIEFQGD